MFLKIHFFFPLGYSLGVLDPPKQTEYWGKLVVDSTMDYLSKTTIKKGISFDCHTVSGIPLLCSKRILLST